MKGAISRHNEAFFISYISFDRSVASCTIIGDASKKLGLDLVISTGGNIQIGIPTKTDLQLAAGPVNLVPYVGCRIIVMWNSTTAPRVLRFQ